MKQSAGNCRRSLANVRTGNELTPGTACDDHRRPQATDRGDTHMLYGIDPILGPDLLHTLRAMGHGDEICIADANFPAVSSRKVRAIRL